MCRAEIIDRTKFIEYAYKFKFYIKMKKIDIVISHLNEMDLSFLNLLGIYINEFINQKEWEKLLKNDFWNLYNINLSKPIEFIAKIIPEKFEFFKENNNVYFFY